MSHVFQIPDDMYDELVAYAAQRGQTLDLLLMTLLTEGVELLKQGETPASLHAVHYNPAKDPLAPFIGAFESDDDPGWIEQHDTYFAGDHDFGEPYGNTK